jgi:hypothetical protein
MRAEILGHLLADVKGYCDRDGEGKLGGSQGLSDLSLLVHALNDLHPKISGCLLF